MITKRFKSILVSLSPDARLLLLLVISEHNHPQPNSFIRDVKQRFGVAVRSAKIKGLLAELKRAGAICGRTINSRELSDSMVSDVAKLNDRNGFGEYNHIVDFCNGTISSINRPKPRIWCEMIAGNSVCFELRRYKRELWRLQAEAGGCLGHYDAPDVESAVTIDPKDFSKWSDRKIIASMMNTVVRKICEQIAEETESMREEKGDDEGKAENLH